MEFRVRADEAVDLVAKGLCGLTTDRKFWTLREIWAVSAVETAIAGLHEQSAASSSSSSLSRKRRVSRRISDVKTYVVAKRVIDLFAEILIELGYKSPARGYAAERLEYFPWLQKVKTRISFDSCVSHSTTRYVRCRPFRMLCWQKRRS